MKLTKMITAVLVMSLGMSLLCCGCTSVTGTKAGTSNDTSAGTTAVTTGTNSTGKGTEETEEKLSVLPDDKILVISRSDNEAEGHQREVTIVTSDGNIYSSAVNFGFGRYQDVSTLSDEEELALLQKYTEPVGRFDKKDLHDMYNHMMKIDADAKFEYSDEICYDAGCTVTRVLTSDGEYVKINESGVKQGELKDHNAKKTMSIIKNYFYSIDYRTLAVCYLPTDTFIGTFKCTKEITGSSRMIITSKEELQSFIDLTGIDLSKIDGFEYFGDTDYDHFNRVCIAVEIKGYDNYLKLQDVSTDAFIVSESYVGFGFVEDSVTDISDHIVEEDYYCHIAVVPNYVMSAYDPFLG